MAEPQGDYELASPCKPQDLVQTLSEPILLRYATQNGFQCRFDTRLLSFTDDSNADTVTSIALDTLTNNRLRIISRYLCGADGARSQIFKSLNLPMVHSPRGGGVAFNVLVEAEMTHIMQHNRGLLHGIVQLEEEPEDYAWICVARMVKPWHEWLFVYFAKPGYSGASASEEDWYRATKRCIGDDSVEVKVKNVSTWKVNESYAEEYRKCNVYARTPYP